MGPLNLFSSTCLLRPKRISLRVEARTDRVWKCTLFVAAVVRIGYLRMLPNSGESTRAKVVDEDLHTVGTFSTDALQHAS